jgi:SPX domain protein involved in polyphosphate accumulation
LEREEIAVDVFRRRELKFLLNDDQCSVIRDALQRKMEPDAHGENTICNIYYDTPDYRLIRHSLEHPVYKEKIRLRSYGVATADSDIYLELKKKYKGVVYKRRVKVTEAEGMAFMDRLGPLRKQNQISREILYFRDFYKTLQPQVYLCYDRQAWYDPQDRGFRMTLDRNIRYRTSDLSLSSPCAGREILKQDQTLLEVKAEGAVPLWLVELLTEEQIFKQSFSKYGRAYEQMLREHLVLQKG